MTKKQSAGGRKNAGRKPKAQRKLTRLNGATVGRSGGKNKNSLIKT